MTPGVSRPSLQALPDWSAVPSNSEDDRILMNRRLAYYGRALFTLNGVFLLFNLALGIARGVALSVQLTYPSVWFHAAAVFTSGAEWWLCRGRKRSSIQLNVIDLSSVLVVMVCCALMVGVSPRGLDQALILMLIAMATLVTRAVIVPATARRTFWVSTLAHVPLLAASYHVLTHVAISTTFQRLNWGALSMTLYSGMWGIVTVSMSTLASRVIYGLAQRVREVQQLGQYTLEEKIGEGGMGVVYRARHALLRRPTAVKLLPRERAGEHNLARFEREVQLTSALAHPNTIAIYDYGHTPDGIFYYAMECLDGITLEELVEHDGPQPPARVKHVIRQIAGALDEAHGIGLIHRDIKPSNIVLCVRGGISDHIKVLDFGLVKELGRAADPQLSAMNAVVGTPFYMAPESITQPANVDARADLYALGAVAYHLLTGRTVFEGATTVEICAKHLHEAPIAPSQRADRPVPAAMEALVLECLAKQASDRPRTAAEVIRRLEQDAEVEVWTADHAKQWWADRGAVVAEAARRARETGSRTPGPHTVAVDFERRAHADTLLEIEGAQ